MKKSLFICSLALFMAGQAQAASTGEAAGAQASTEARGASNVEGVTAIGALLGVALATAGGGDGANTGTTTTTTTSTTR